MVLGSTVWYLGSQSLCLSLEECQGQEAAASFSVMGKHRSQSVASHYPLLQCLKARVFLHSKFLHKAHLCASFPSVKTGSASLHFTELS